MRRIMGKLYRRGEQEGLEHVSQKSEEGTAQDRPPEEENGV